MPWTKLPRSLQAQCLLPTSFHLSGSDKLYPLVQRVSEDWASPGDTLWIAAVCVWVIPPWSRHLHYRFCPRRGLTPPNQSTPGFVTSCSNVKTWPGSSVFLTAWFRRISQKQFSIQWVIYITYYRFLWSQLGNLPGHCSLFPTTSTLHKEESFQANSVPLAALFLPHHPSSLSISWPAKKCFSLSQILTMLHFIFASHFAKSGAGRARLAGRFTHELQQAKPVSHSCGLC